jgi:Fe2+ or Zn2+ uptake regulation protein
MKIINQLKKNGLRVNRFTVKDQLDKSGFEMSVSTVYRDMTAINRENTWVRDLAESNYSVYQENISNAFDWLEMQASEQFEATKNHVWLNIILKVQDTRIKHTNGDNVNLSVALLGKKFNELIRQEENKEQEITVDVIKLCKLQHTDNLKKDDYVYGSST